MSDNGSLTVTEAAQELDVNPSTAQRLLVTLVADGFAQQGERKRYELGPASSRLAHASTPLLRSRVRPFLERLFERVDETVHLAVLIGTEIHHLDGIEASHTLRFGLRTGVRLPAHVTSAGKAMLAELPNEAVKARYDGIRQGEATVDLDELYRVLANTRHRGIGVNFEESEPGVAAFAAALGTIDGETAALSIAMPNARFSRNDTEKYAHHLNRTVDEARSSLLG